MPQPHRQPSRGALVLLAASTLLAACASGGSPPPAPGPDADAAPIPPSVPPPAPDAPPQDNQQEIVGGANVTTQRQRELGLVTINNGCSATLLDRFWVLTARHCVTVDGSIAGTLSAPNQVTMTATWAPGVTATATLIHELSPNRPIPGRDIVLVLFGRGEIANLANQPLLNRRLRTSDSVTQYGRGFSSFATGVWMGNPPATPAGGIGTYRSASFTPSSISGTAYELVMNAGNQIGHGGDSGGPTWLVENGAHVGIAGVQSTCSPSGYIPGAPRQWPWATGIRACQYVSVEPLVAEIRDALAFRNVGVNPGWQPGPPCPAPATCAVPAIVDYLQNP